MKKQVKVAFEFKKNTYIAGSCARLHIKIGMKRSFKHPCRSSTRIQASGIIRRRTVIGMDMTGPERERESQRETAGYVWLVGVGGKTRKRSLSAETAETQR